MATNEASGQRGENGHADPLADADTVKLEPLNWPPPLRRFDRVRRIMSGRVRPSAREDAEPLTRVPGWLTSLAVGALLLGVGQAGALIYKLSHYDTVEVQTIRDFNDLSDALDRALTAQDQYNQLIVIYENKVQNILIQHGIKQSELPEIPKRPTFPPKRRRGAGQGD